MRYFRRVGQQDIRQESGPRGIRVIERGDTISYDTDYDDERHWAFQLAGDPGYIEVDASGKLLPAGSAPEMPIVYNDTIPSEE